MTGNAEMGRIREEVVVAYNKVLTEKFPLGFAQNLKQHRTVGDRKSA
jgi:hypothetical protein